jgi:hypothetical protein
MNQPNKEEEKINKQKEETTDQESLLRPKAGSVNKPEKAKKSPFRARLNASPTNGKTAIIIES